MRDWVACLVRPLTDHLETLGNPTWYARFAAQAMTDPAYYNIIVKGALSSPSLVQVVDGINRCLPDLPAEVRFERNIMARNLLMHTCADRERALAAGSIDAPNVLAGRSIRSYRRDSGPVAGAGDPERVKSLQMKVTVDQDICASSGNCVMNAPELFDQRDEDGVVVLLNANPPAEQSESARRAAAQCPALAIHIEE